MRNMQQIFQPNGKNNQKIAVLAASARASDPVSEHCYAVELYATENIYLEVSDDVEKTGSTTSGVTTGLSYFIPASTLIKIAVPDNSVLNVQAETTDGTLYINELTS